MLYEQLIVCSTIMQIDCSDRRRRRKGPVALPFKLRWRSTSVYDGGVANAHAGSTPRPYCYEDNWENEDDDQPQKQLV